MNDHDSAKPGINMQAWMQLLRVSAAPTAVSNILAGFLLANQSWQPTMELLLLIAASVTLYMSGMVLNDWCDADMDLQIRSDRPIPSGRISLTAAMRAYLLLTAIGLLLAGSVGTKSLAVAILLVLAIFSYNAVVKSTVLAPAMMGFCRLLNMLLGASVSTLESSDGFLVWPLVVWWIAIGLAVLITGLTWFARNESRENSRIQLQLAALTVAAGLCLYAGAGYVVESAESIRLRYAAVILLVSLPIVRRLVIATSSLQPQAIQAAVITVLRSLIFFDAAVCYLASNSQIIYPVITLCLIAPAVLLSKWSSST